MKKYYCWVVLGCLFLMYMASNGIALNTFNLYIPEFAKSFGVDIAQATGWRPRYTSCSPCHCPS